MSTETVTVIGIDEAGLGPMLGPLVVSGCAFRAPADVARGDLWQALDGCVTRQEWLRPFKTVVGDSKKLYNTRRGIGPLEESVLSFVRLAHGEIPNAAALLDRIGAREAAFDGAPWYNPEAAPLPLAVEPADVARRAELLAEGLAAAGVSFEGFCSRPVFEREFNAGMERLDNKSTALFQWTAEVLANLFERHDGELLVYCDRQGGRRYYTRSWAEAFDGCAFKILENTPARARFIVTRRGRRIEVVFGEKGDSHWLPTALASMASKYVREVFMAQFNAFWAEHAPEVKPTAGYAVDARRFLNDVEDTRRRLRIDADALVRTR